MWILFCQFIDGLPTHICLSCCTLLKTWDTFMQVYHSSQQQFKLGLELSGTCTRLPPKKRKASEQLEYSAMLSPSTSGSSVQASPDSCKLAICTPGGGGSDTDDASECPPEVVQERLPVRPKRPPTRKTPVRQKKTQPAFQMQPQVPQHVQQGSFAN